MKNGSCRAAAGERGRGLRRRHRIDVGGVGRAVVEHAAASCRTDWRTAARPPNCVLSWLDDRAQARRRNRRRSPRRSDRRWRCWRAAARVGSSTRTMRDVVLGVGRGVGVGQIDRCCRSSRPAVSTSKSGLRARRSRRCRRRSGPTAPATSPRRAVELVLRLHQHVVAHVEIGRDLAGADRLVGDQIDRARRSATPA